MIKYDEILKSVQDAHSQNELVEMVAEEFRKKGYGVEVRTKVIKTLHITSHPGPIETLKGLKFPPEK